MHRPDLSTGTARVSILGEGEDTFHESESSAENGKLVDGTPWVMFHFEVYLLCTDHQGRFQEKDTINDAPLLSLCQAHISGYYI